MSLRAIIFDIDGTLIDTNPSHVEAWSRAFQRFGFEVPHERITVEIGKGGDKLVPSVLGEKGEKEYGERLRKAQKEEFLAIAGRERFRVFPGVSEIFPALRDRGIRTALATSSDEQHLDATLQSAGNDVRRLADVTVTRSKDDASKPSPDLIEEALEELKLRPGDCAMVGDTIYDGQACQAAGVMFIGVLTGPASETELLEAGARGVWPDLEHLLRELDRVLELASPTAASPQ
jgi:HAD superfamily hydrolase (TIGR01549 family)